MNFLLVILTTFSSTFLAAQTTTIQDNGDYQAVVNHYDFTLSKYTALSSLVELNLQEYASEVQGPHAKKSIVKKNCDLLKNYIADDITHANLLNLYGLFLLLKGLPSGVPAGWDAFVKTTSESLDRGLGAKRSCENIEASLNELESAIQVTRQVLDSMENSFR